MTSLVILCRLPAAPGVRRSAPTLVSDRLPVTSPASFRGGRSAGDGVFVRMPVFASVLEALLAMSCLLVGGVAWK